MVLQRLTPTASSEPSKPTIARTPEPHASQPDVCASETSLHAAPAGERERQACLALIRQPRHVGEGVLLGEDPEGLRTGVEVLEEDPLVGARAGCVADPQVHVCDDPEHALGAHDHLPQRRAGGARRHRGQVDVAARGAASRIPSTMSAIAPYPVDAWPADLVAAQPPSETYSKDCG